MTEQFQCSEHCKPAILNFLSLTLCKNFWAEIRLSLLNKSEEVSETNTTWDKQIWPIDRTYDIEISEEAPVVDGSNEEEHLGPSESRNVAQGSYTVTDGFGSNSAIQVEAVVESVKLGHDVSDNSKHGNTTVLSDYRGKKR